MANYTIKTDDFECDDIEAENIDDAIDQCDFGATVNDADALRRLFERKYVADGGWCWIEQDGEKVFEVGECP